MSEQIEAIKAAATDAEVLRRAAEIAERTGRNAHGIATELRWLADRLESLVVPSQSGLKP
jgi:hypothetical protein